MFEQPNQLGRDTIRDRRGARVHGRQRGLVGNQAVADPPFDRHRNRIEADHHFVARSGHVGFRSRRPLPGTSRTAAESSRSGAPTADLITRADAGLRCAMPGMIGTLQGRGPCSRGVDLLHRAPSLRRAAARPAPIPSAVVAELVDALA